jgi:hypothetical protein
MTKDRIQKEIGYIKEMIEVLEEKLGEIEEEPEKPKLDISNLPINTPVLCRDKDYPDGHWRACFTTGTSQVRMYTDNAPESWANFYEYKLPDYPKHGIWVARNEDGSIEVINIKESELLSDLKFGDCREI